jgi:shikimate kinase
MAAVADTNLYLVGFMGTGKTSVGRAAAARLGYRFLDSDHEIERAAGRTVTEIFAERGEAAFRALEREFVERGHPASRHVISCGGGLVVPPGMAELLKTKGVVMCLHASPETIHRRTQSGRHRPLLDVPDPLARIRELLAAREPAYRRAGTVILTDGRTQADIVAHILRAYRAEAADFARARAGRPA